MSANQNAARGLFRVVAVLGTVCTVASLAVAGEPAGAASNKTVQAASVIATPVENLSEKWGIEFSGLFVSAGGNMVDFRFKVIDPAKAAFLANSELVPELLNQNNGTKLIVPNTSDVGPLRQTSRAYVAG